MKRIRSLRSSTSLKPFGDQVKKSTPSIGTGFVLSRRPSTQTGGGTVLIQSDIPEFKLSERDIAELNQKSEGRVTRHFAPKYLESALNGYLRFGTLRSYRASEDAKLSRLGDPTESRIRDTFESTTGNYGRIDHYGGQDIRISGIGNGSRVNVETLADEFCLCCSDGDFDRDRAMRFREQGNRDLGAYVTYDLLKLLKIIRAVLSRNDAHQQLRTISRTVAYSHKDSVSIVADLTPRVDGNTPIDVWRRIAFVKPEAFKHEDEVRILLVDPDRAGRLLHHRRTFIMDDKMIADAIVGHGLF